MFRVLLFVLLGSLFSASVTPVPAQARKKKPRSTRQAATKPKPAVVAPVGVGTFEHQYSLYKNPEGNSSQVKKPEALLSLDAFIQSCIMNGVFPGCQILAACKGEIIYQKNFGNYTYDQSRPVTDSSLYDVASVTKVVATTLAVMKLYDEGKIKLDAYLKNYLPMVEGTDKANLTIKDLLLHQAGLKAWIPFHKKTLDTLTGAPRTDLYRRKGDSVFSTPVAAHFFIKNAYKETIWDEILGSTLDNKGKYVYSDLDFYFLEEVVRVLSGRDFETYVTDNFYRPLGLKNTQFNPWKKGLLQQCVPTENDQYFRFQLIQGYVHDPGTALLGGVAGHAGIFSNARELGVILQMLANGGEYKGRRFFSKETVQLFSGYRSAISRRAYGFDKPDKAKGNGGPASELCSKSAFGHQGFTGTCVWTDPETGIVFVFLSNRVYPNAENTQINKLNVRSKAQSYIYQALGYGA